MCARKPEHSFFICKNGLCNNNNLTQSLPPNLIVGAPRPLKISIVATFKEYTEKSQAKHHTFTFPQIATQGITLFFFK